MSSEELVNKLLYEKNYISQSLLMIEMVDLIKKDQIDLNKVMAKVLSNLTYNNYYLVGTLIRLGVDPNIYFQLKSYRVHILVYLAMNYSKQKFSKDLYKRTAFILILSGSNYDEKATLESDTTIVNYLTALNMEIYSIKAELSFIDSEILMILDSPYTLKKENINNYNVKYIINDFKSLDYELMIKSLSYNVAKLVDYENSPNMNIDMYGMPLLVSASVHSGNFNFYKIFLDKGLRINYFVINYIIYKFNRSSTQKEKYNFSEMLIYSIEKGIELDLYQFNFINDDNLRKTVNQAYSIPKWEKLCSSSFDVRREELEKISHELNLNFNMNEKQICSKLKSLKYLTEDQFMSQNEENHQQKIEDHLKKEYNIITPIKCENSGMEMYSNSKIASYLDSDSKLWCFTSDMFKNLIKTGMNPYTNKNLPVEFITTLNTQLQVMYDLNISHGEIKDDYRSIIDKPDQISNDRSDYIKLNMEKIFESYGITKDRLEYISTQTMNDCLSKIKINQVYLFSLTREHQYITFLRAIKSVTKRNKSLSNDIYQTILRSLS